MIPTNAQLDTLTNLAYAFANASSDVRGAASFAQSQARALETHGEGRFGEVLRQVRDDALAEYAEARERQVALRSLIEQMEMIP